jgi:hypothetical protein
MPIISRVSSSRFKNLCFVGLNKVEFHPESGEVLFAANWQDVVDEPARRSLMLGFFAPRDLTGDPVDPMTILGTGEDTPPEALAQMYRNVALFDFCRIRPAAANTVNVLIVADAIFHWDVNDSYVLPTSTDTWVRNLQQILKQYPRSTTKNVYTAWDTSKAKELEANFYGVRELPFDTGMWLNMPSVQEKYANHALVAGVLAAGMAYGVVYLQDQQIKSIQQDISRAQQVVGGNAAAMLNVMEQINQQEQYMRYRTLISLIMKDLGLTLKDANLKLDSFGLDNSSPNTPPTALVASFKMQDRAYVGFQQQEPVAKLLLRNSAVLTAVRKPPGETNALVLEGLIPLSDLGERVSSYLANVKNLSGAVLSSDGIGVGGSPTAAVTATTPTSPTGGAQ